MTIYATLLNLKLRPKIYLKYLDWYSMSQHRPPICVACLFDGFWTKENLGCSDLWGSRFLLSRRMGHTKCYVASRGIKTDVFNYITEPPLQKENVLSNFKILRGTRCCRQKWHPDPGLLSVFRAAKLSKYLSESTEHHLFDPDWWNWLINKV